MSWLTKAVGLRSRRMPFEDETTPETVRAEWMARWMEEDHGPRASEADPPVLFRWEGHWTRWSQMSHTYEPVEGRLIPSTLVEFGNTLDPPPTEGDRFRFTGGEWTRLTPDEPDEPTEHVEPAETPSTTGPTAAAAPARPPVVLPPATPAPDPVADQIAAWRRRIRS